MYHVYRQTRNWPIILLVAIGIKKRIYPNNLQVLSIYIKIKVYNTLFKRGLYYKPSVIGPRSVILCPRSLSTE